MVTIPVVFHVIYANETENISDAQIQSQLDILNEDFRRLNANQDDVWAQAADTQIEFCLEIARRRRKRVQRHPSRANDCGFVWHQRRHEVHLARWL